MIRQTAVICIVDAGYGYGVISGCLVRKDVLMRAVLRVDRGVLGERIFFRDPLAVYPLRIPAREEYRRIAFRRRRPIFRKHDMAVDVGLDACNFAAAVAYFKRYCADRADLCARRRSFHFVCREGSGQIVSSRFRAELQVFLQQILLGDHIALAVQKDSHRDADRHRLQGVVADVGEDLISAFRNLHKRIRCNLLTAVFGHKSLEGDEAAVVAGIDLCHFFTGGLLDPCLCVNTDSALGDLLRAADEIGYVHRPLICEDTAVNICVACSGNCDRFADLLRKRLVPIERQLDSFAASNKRNSGCVGQANLNISLAAFLAEELHARDAHVGAVEHQLAGFGCRFIRSNGIIDVLYRCFRNRISHRQDRALIRKERDVLNGLAFVTKLNGQLVHRACAGVLNGELYRQIQAGNKLTEVCIRGYFNRGVLEFGSAKLHVRERILRQDCQQLAAVFRCNGLVRQVDGVVGCEPIERIVVAAKYEDVHLAVFAGVGIKMIHRKVRAGFGNIGLGSHADCIAGLEQAHCVQLVLAVVCFVLAVLFLRPNDGELAQSIGSGRRRELEVCRDAGCGVAADALREGFVHAAVGVDARKADIMGFHVLLGSGLRIGSLFAGIVLGIPAGNELIANGCNLRIGIGIAVVGQAAGGDNAAVCADHGIEGFGCGNVFACADGVDENRSAVRQHSGVDGVHRACAAVVGNLGIRPARAVINTVVDIVLSVKHC